MMEASNIRIAHMLHGCRTLGPGSRTVVWVRGCSRHCPGCIATPILDNGPALVLRPEELVARVLETEDQGVTFSGGEPFEQAAAISQTARYLRKAGRSVMVYSGYTLKELEANSNPWTKALLDQTDVLVDGPFDLSRQADLLWRGSSNQRIHVLTPRYRDLLAAGELPGAGVEVRMDADGRLFWAGVPPVGFVSSLRQAGEDRGIELSANGGVWA